MCKVAITVSKKSFVDTMNVLKKALPGCETYAESSLEKDLLNETYEAHNAKDDVKLLVKLLQKVGLNANGIKKVYLFTSSSA